MLSLIQRRKKKKVRVVFDCSAKYSGVSLNDKLLQGPDLMNSLVGILCRFREKPIAIACDIEMFYNFKVVEKDRNLLRFLWYDKEGKTVLCRMTVHLFGANSSPAVATYGLRFLANLHIPKYATAAKFIQRDFYVDDGITSVHDVSEGITLIQEARKICADGNLRLHKFISNSKEVLKSLPAS